MKLILMAMAIGLLTSCVTDVQDLKKPVKILGVTAEPQQCTAMFVGVDGEIVYRGPHADFCKLLGKEGQIFAE